MRRTRNSSITAFCICLSLGLLLGACGGKGASTAQNPLTQTAPPSAAELARELPALSDLRSTSTPLTQNRLKGSQAQPVSPAGASIADPELSLNAAQGELAWGIYTLDITPQITQRWLDLLLYYPEGTPEDQPVWIALGDYSAGRWELHHPSSEGTAFDLSDPRYLSAQQSFAVAVLAYDGGTVTVRQLSLLAGPANSPPVADLQANVTSGPAPLSVTFSAAGSSDIDNNILSYHWDFDGDGINEETGSPNSEAHTYNGGGVFTAILVVVDSYGEQATAELTITINGGNQSPVADFLVLPETVEILEAVTLDGSGSSDPDGSIAKYEWDTDGDGVFETDTQVENNTDAFTFSTGGVRTLSLRVTDDDGATDTASAPLYVRGWSGPIEPAPGEGSGLLTASLARINGRPAITYRSESGGQRYARAVDEFGAGWGASLRVSNSSTAISFNSLAEIFDNPAVVFGNNNTQKLRYCRALNPDGTEWPDPQTVAENVKLVRPILFEVAGILPGVAWSDLDSISDELYFASAFLPDGTSWDSLEVIANADGYGFQAGLIDGNPAVVYSDAGNSKGYYLRADNLHGGSWLGPPELVSSTPNQDLSMKFGRLIETSTGRPAVAAVTFDPSLNQAGLSYYLGNSSGQNWATEEDFSTLNNSILNDLALINGKPALLYSVYDSSDDLEYIFYTAASNNNGSNWEAVQTVWATQYINDLHLIDNGGSPALLIVSSLGLFYIYFTP